MANANDTSYNESNNKKIHDGAHFPDFPKQAGVHNALAFFRQN